MTLLLQRDEVEDLIDLERAIALTKEMFRAQAAGEVSAGPPTHVGVPAGALRLVSGAVLSLGVMGVRAGGAEALGGRGGTALLYDSESSDLLSVMAYGFGSLRTSAVFGVVTEAFADSGVDRLAVLGTGRSALGLIEAARLVRDISHVSVYGRTPSKREALVERVRAAGLEADGFGSVAEATRDAEVVFVATQAFEPVLRAADIRPGTLVVSMGTPCELDRGVYLVAERVFVTSRHHEEHFLDVWASVAEKAGVTIENTLLALDRQKQQSWSHVEELATVLAGDAELPRRGQTVVVRESQGGCGDVAFAAWIYGEARRLGRGTEFAFR